MADIIHVPRQRALLLQNALDATLEKPLEDLLAAAARLKTRSRTVNQQKDFCWRDRLKIILFICCEIVTCWTLGIKFVELIVRRRRRGDASG